MLEEYRQLYTLVLFRLNALDQRVPLVGAALTGLTGAVSLLAPSLQVILIVSLPLSSLWLLLTTINHARSLEDALRRIEEIERAVSKEQSPMPMVFQSSHPSRGVHVGGRTGEITIQAVALCCLLVSISCVLIAQYVVRLPAWAVLPYAVFLGAVVAACGLSYSRLRGYKYLHRPGK
jgi:hypothetical protein